MSMASTTSNTGVWLKAGNGDTFRTDIDSGEIFEVPPGFIGTYSGDIDDGRNSLCKYLYNYNVPTLLKDSAQPKINLNSFNDLSSGIWNSAQINYVSMIDTLKFMGVEDVMLDIGWWAGDGFNQPDQPSADPVDWPSGMLWARNYAHNKGMDFGLYWNRTTSMTKNSGISKRESEAKYLYDNFLIDSYRSDGTDGNVLPYGGYGAGTRAHYNQDVGYWQTKGYYEFLDWCYANITGFQYENCSGGGRIEDFGIMKRSMRIQITDAYSVLDAQRALYDALYTYPASQLAAYIMSGPGDMKYWFRSSSMGKAQLACMTTTLNMTQKNQIAACVTTYKNKVRLLIKTADVYHIFPRPDDTQWTGMEYYDKTSGIGVVYIFRPNTSTSSQYIKLKGLASGSNYTISFEDGSNPTVTMSGATLMSTGINVSLTDGTYTSELMWIDKH
jgi:hypothetical protein